MKKSKNVDTDIFEKHLSYLKLSFIREHYDAYAAQAARNNSSHLAYLSRLIEGEAKFKLDRSTERRIRLARFPVIKTLDGFKWSFPTEINRLKIENLFRLKCVQDKENVIFLGGVGVGKTHFSIALGHAACLKGYSVLFLTAIDAVNSLAAAQAAGRFPQELRKYEKPNLLILDELGYLPIDKKGANLLFQIISKRYEQGSIIITSNRPYKKWSEIFNNDSTLTSAILDRLLHHATTVQIKGPSFRMNEKIED